MSFAGMIFSHYPAAADDHFINSVIVGLQYLLQETRDTEPDNRSMVRQAAPPCGQQPRVSPPS
jgi:hypothetical protein